MRYIFICLLCLCGWAFAGQRTETVRVVKLDTIVTVKPDTIKTPKVDTIVNIKMDTTVGVRVDTLKIVKTFRDTAVFLRQDTSRLQGKLIKLKKK
jgi:hypothetical protein